MVSAYSFEHRSDCVALFQGCGLRVMNPGLGGGSALADRFLFRTELDESKLELGINHHQVLIVTNLPKTVSNIYSSSAIASSGTGATGYTLGFSLT